MSELELGWYGFVAICSMIVVTNWRKGVYVGILLDVLRDPVRKVIEDQPVLITLSGVIPWALLIFVAAISQHTLVRSLVRQYPRLRLAMLMLLIAIVPAAALTIINYHRGWVVALIGSASYIIPALGVVVGYGFLRSETGALRILRFYILVNVLMLFSVPCEYLSIDLPGLGGIQHDWIRYRTGYTVDLMCGWYRSPDIMGLHAAHVIMFSLLLAARSRTDSQFTWLLPALWAGFCVLVSGRRKMIGIPMVFLATFVLLGMLLKMRRANRLSGFSFAALMLGGAIALVFWSPDDAAEYTDFAGSLFTEGLDRGNEVIVGSTIGTLQQSGILGVGLGTASQGRYYVWAPGQGPRTWQEDGVSRLFVEFGVPGVILLCLSILAVAFSLSRAVKLVRPQSREQLMQVGLLSVVAGDAASFAISHQQFSGDPINALLVTLLIGMVFRFPALAPRLRQSFRRFSPRIVGSRSATSSMTVGTSIPKQP